MKKPMRNKKRITSGMQLLEVLRMHSVAWVWRYRKFDQNILVEAEIILESLPYRGRYGQQIDALNRRFEALRK
jgi:hypothetical protein